MPMFIQHCNARCTYCGTRVISWLPHASMRGVVGCRRGPLRRSCNECVCAQAHARAMPSAVCMPVSPQLYFNDARDNESRAARHKSRCDASLMALGIATLKHRYPHSAHIDLSPEDVASMSDSLTLDKHTFGGSTNATSLLTFDVDELVNARSKWRSTSPGKFELNQAFLFKVLLSVDSDHWEFLWLSSLYKVHTIVSDSELNYYYILQVAPKGLLLLEMVEESEGILRFGFGPERVKVTAPPSVDYFICWDVELGFHVEGDESRVRFRVGEAFGVLRYAIRNYFSLWPAPLLKSIAKHLLDIKVPSGASHIDVATSVVNASDATEPERQAAISAVKALIEKRCQRRAEKLRQPDDGDARDQDDVDSDASDPGLHDGVVTEQLRAEARPELVALASKEVDYLLGACPAGQALGEEEDDRGVEQLKLHADAKVASRPPRRVRKKSPPVSSQASKRPRAPSPSPPSPFLSPVKGVCGQSPPGGIFSPNGDQGQVRHPTLLTSDEENSDGPVFIPWDQSADCLGVGPPALPDPPASPELAMPVAGSGPGPEPPVSPSVSAPPGPDTPPEPAASVAVGARAHDFSRVPLTCQFCLVEPLMRSPYWVAKLPHGLEYRGSKSHSATFGRMRSEEQAAIAHHGL